MAVRAWRLWGISTVLAGGRRGARPAAQVGRERPGHAGHHPGPFPARIGPAAAASSRSKSSTPTPSKTAPPTGEPLDPLVGRAAAVEPTSGGPRWKARAALDVAEMYFRACDTAEARNWYREVIQLAPDSEYARTRRRTTQGHGRPCRPAARAKSRPWPTPRTCQVRVRIP